MGSRFHGLHPLKRFKLQQQNETEENPNSPPLPAKKRKESRNPLPTTTTTTTTTYCLPAKKRVLALQPLYNSPQKPISSFDLNVEYQQSPEKESPILHKNQSEIKEGKTVIEGFKSHKDEEEVEVVVEEEEEEEDDGIVCVVCNSTDGDPSDPIVFCDGCDLMVHASCYGDPLIHRIPEGDWFCTNCQISSPSPKICCLCPVKGGAMKPTTDDRWAHIVCALLVPEVFFKDPDGREGIDCSRVPLKRFEDVCYICDSTNGCSIECSEPKCSLAFHVTCGLNEELCIEYREGRSGRGGAIVAGFCKTHTELWKRQQQTGKFKIVAREDHKK